MAVQNTGVVLTWAHGIISGQCDVERERERERREQKEENVKDLACETSLVLDVTCPSPNHWGGCQP